MPSMEIRTKTYGTGKSAYRGAELLIDGNDISNDVLSVDIHLDGRGSNRAVVELIPALVDIEGASIQLTEETVRGLNAMGWRTDEQVRRVLEQINSDGSAEASNAIHQAVTDAMAAYMKTLPDNDIAHGAALGAMQVILDAMPKTMPVEKPE